MSEGFWIFLAVVASVAGLLNLVGGDETEGAVWILASFVALGQSERNGAAAS